MSCTRSLIYILLMMAIMGQGFAQQDTTGRAAATGRATAAQGTDSVHGKTLREATVTAQRSFIQFSANKITLNIASDPIAIGGSAYDALLRAPGVMEQQDALTFRGRSVKILVNGRPSHLTGEDLKTMLTSMSASGVEKIEIIPSPPAKYEAEGSCIIDVILSKNKSFGTNYVATAGGGGGRYGSANGGLDVNHRDKGTNIYGGVTYLHNQQYYSTTTDRILPGADIYSDEYDVRTRNNYGYKLGLDEDPNRRTSYGFLLNGYINKRQRVVSNMSGIRETGDADDSSVLLSTTGHATFSNPTLNLYYKRILDSAGKELSINADWMDYHKQWTDSFANHYLTPEDVDYAPLSYMLNHSPADIRVYSWTADYVQPVRNGKWEAGVRFNYTTSDNTQLWDDNAGEGWTVDTTKTNHFIYKEDVNAAYIDHSHTLKKWTVEAGLRAEQTISSGNLVTLGEVNRQHYLNLFPTLSLTFNHSAGNQWSFTYRKSIQRFGFDYINPFIIYQSQYAYSQGNPNLQPQINHSFALSTSIAGKVWVGIEYTRSLHTLGASYRSVGDLTISTYDNFKGANIGYAYVNYARSIGTVWQVNFYGSFGYFDYNLATDSTPAQPANEKPFYAIQWYNSFAGRNGFSADLNLSYTSALVTGIFQRQPYYYADAGINKSLSKGNLTLRASLKDVFNTQRIKTHTNYDEVDLYTNAKYESRIFNFTARYRFGNNNVRARKQRQSAIDDINSRLN